MFPFLIKRLNQLQKMLQMPDILTNTSPLIALDRIGRLEILKSLYGQVHCTEEVAVEFGADDIPNGIIVPAGFRFSMAIEAEALRLASLDELN